MLKIAMLQTPAIELDGQGVKLPFKRAEALLYYMLVRRSATRQELIALLWESCDETTGLKNLRNALYTLKKSLGGDLLLSPQKSLIVVNSQWETDSDYDRFVRQGDLSAYGGPFLQGFGVKHALGFEEWLMRTRETLHEQYLSRLSDLAAAAKQRGDLGQAVRQAQEYLREDPYDEEMAVFLMSCYQDMRKYNKAAQVYQRLKRQLSEELGAAPMEETTLRYYRMMDQWNDTAPDPQADPGIPPGREEAYARLLAAEKSFAAGEARRCAYLLTGEGGAGKSALAECLLRFGAKEGIVTVRSACPSGREPRPLALWDQILEQLGPLAQRKALSEPMDRLQGHIAAFREGAAYDQGLEEAAAALFAGLGRRCRILLAAEDLQWSGAESLWLLDALLRRREGDGLMLLLTCRDRAPADTLRCLQDLERDGLLRRLRLHPLTPGELHTALEQRLGAETARQLAPRFYRETGGDVRLLGRLLDVCRQGGDAEAAARSVREALAERIAGLSDEALETAELLSLFEGDVRRSLLLGLMEGDEGRLARGLYALGQRGILEEHEDGADTLCAFVQPRIGALVCGQIPKERRHQLHRRAARLLEGEGTGESGACRRLSRHFALAGEPLQALGYQVQALELESARRFEPFPLCGQEPYPRRSARQMLQEVQACRAQAAQLRGRQGGQALDRLENRLQLIGGRIALFRGEIRQATDLLGSLSGSACGHDASLMVQACYLLCVSAVFRQQPELAERYAATGARLLRLGRDDAAQIRFQRLRGSCFCLRGEYGKAEYYLREAMDALEQLPQTPPVQVQLAAACCDMGNILRRKGDYARACGCYKRALALLSDGAYPGKVWIDVHYGRTAFLLEDHQLARQLFRRGYDAARRSGELWGRTAAAAYTAYYQAREGSWDACLESLRDAAYAHGRLSAPLEGVILRFVQMHIRLWLEQGQIKHPGLDRMLPYSAESYARQGIRTMPALPDVYESAQLSDSLRCNLTARQHYRASELYSKNKHFMAE